MATSTTSDTTDESTDNPPFYRLKTEVEIPFSGSMPSASKVRALLTPMAIEEVDPNVYRVTAKENTYRADLEANECSCTAGTQKEDYKCRHIHHVEHRRRSGTAINPPDREDPVMKQARENKPVAEASRKREEQFDRAGGVVAGPGESLVQCVSCEEHNTIPKTDGVDTSVYVCPSCPPIDDSIVYLNDPQDAADDSLVLVQDIVADESARSHYPGDESVFSLADLFSDIDGVSGSDSVVQVSLPVDVDGVAGMLFASEAKPVPQGALRRVFEAEL